ncbi:MAG: hypothetical protein A3I66_17105 [Burkholderiales bacterium RIFCSPLOWO2_02_FULL_57_36]|nr:MAG: hypothetical protein A3I66_17105 [Burkholderiales bacterium RIFCSPLOWO2_02_FULL_57_36]
MMGLLVLIVLGLYLVLSVYLVVCASRFAKKYFNVGWPFGIVVGLIMYNFVFWDAIPTWYTHHHLCTTEAGLKVYQTPEEWAKENPERYQKARTASERVISRRSSDNSEATQYRVEYASELALENYNSRQRNYGFNTGVARERVIDTITGKVLFEVIDFHSGAGTKSLAVGASSFADYKFWTVTGRCTRAYPSMSDRFKYNGDSFSDFLIAMERWNK